MTTEVSDSSVEKTIAPIVSTPEVATGESTQPVEIKGPLGVGGTVVDAADITLPSSPAEDVKPEEEKKTLEEESKGVEITNSDFLQDSVVPLLKYLDRKKKKYAVSKEVGFYVEMMRNRTQLKRAEAVKREWDSATELARERAASLSTEEAYDEAVKRSERLIVTAERREKNHVEELAELEVRRAEEVRIAKELRGKIAEAKTAEEDLRSKISEIAAKCSEVECKLTVESDCRRLREQLGKADMRLQESQRRMEKAKEAYRQLRDESTDELKLRLKKCLNRFAM
ncbi:hypothetical protein AXG93_4874s1150 [Marchantia polymorpha subsp. ruderalis]|uniref:Uncharacterized protein n=1 Tax=Marchantia polymorpha subsp. ruderalis TaxID=1480154 RepID=A0A176WHE2_MARPO|nr:hypothetical protein AXG93_4874s1150 [Marchantia polymorpha subsp. ruderalis]